LHEALDGPIDRYIDLFELLKAPDDRKLFDQFEEYVTTMDRPELRQRRYLFEEIVRPPFSIRRQNAFLAASPEVNFSISFASLACLKSLARDLLISS